MLNFTHGNILNLKRVRFYNLSTMWKYLSIRYKVFIKELNRPIIGEFGMNDLLAEHYILKKGAQTIGSIRILYRKKKIAEIGRVAILKHYRNQGYGTLLIKQAIELIKLHNQANTIRLFTENKKVIFYQKFGFIEKDEAYFDGIPYIQMISTI